MLRAILCRSLDPGKAVEIARLLLSVDVERNEGALVKILLLECERLGLGSLSPVIAFSDPIRWRQAEWYPPLLPKGNDRVDGLGSLLEILGTLDSPVVTSQFLYDFQELLGLREIRGPFWSRSELVLRDCPHLERLPDLMVVHGNLEITNCPSLARFPRRLEVWGDLTIRNLPRLGRWACRMQLGGRVRKEGAPGLDLIPLSRSGRSGDRGVSLDLKPNWIN